MASRVVKGVRSSLCQGRVLRFSTRGLSISQKIINIFRDIHCGERKCIVGEGQLYREIFVYLFRIRYISLYMSLYVFIWAVNDLT